MSAAGDGRSREAPPKGALLRIRPVGRRRHALELAGRRAPLRGVRSGDGVLVGTGGRGKVYRVGDDGRWALVATLPAEQVTGTRRAPPPAASALVTANPARVLALDGAPAAQGTLRLEGQGRGVGRELGAALLGGHGARRARRSQAETRAGNTATPDATWTEWSPPPARGRARPPARRRASSRCGWCSPAAAGATPDRRGGGRGVPAAQPAARRPARSRSTRPARPSRSRSARAASPRSWASTSTRSASARPPRARPPARRPRSRFSRKLYQRGLRTFSWQADDPNGDALLFDVEYRARGRRPSGGRCGSASPSRSSPGTPPPCRAVATCCAWSRRTRRATRARSRSPARRPDGSFEVDNAPPAHQGACSIPAVRGLHPRHRAGRREPRAAAGDVDRRRPLGGRPPEDGIADSHEESYRSRSRRADRQGPAARRAPRHRPARQRRHGPRGPALEASPWTSCSSAPAPSATCSCCGRAIAALRAAGHRVRLLAPEAPARVLLGPAPGSTRCSPRTASRSRRRSRRDWGDGPRRARARRGRRRRGLHAQRAARRAPGASARGASSSTTRPLPRAARTPGSGWREP